MKKIIRDIFRYLLSRSPIYRGITRIVDAKPLIYLTSTSEIVVTNLKRGPKIIVDLSDDCGRKIFFLGDSDPRITTLCVASLNPGDSFIDIGANYGEIALAAAARVGLSGRVHVFEPNPDIAPMIRRSAELNGFGNLTVHEIALGNFNGTGDLAVPDRISSVGSLVRSNKSDTNTHISVHRVRVRVAGEVMEELNLPSLAAIKIDAEGMDSIILENMRGYLERLRPRLVVFESLETDGPFFERGSVVTLQQLGYEIFQLVIGKGLTARPMLAPIRAEKDVLFGHDFVAKCRS